MNMNKSEQGEGFKDDDRRSSGAAAAGATGDAEQERAAEVRSSRTAAVAAAAADRGTSSVVQRRKDGADSKGVAATVENVDSELAKARQALQRRRRSGQDSAAAARGRRRRRRLRNVQKKDSTTTTTMTNPKSAASPSVTVARTEAAVSEEMFQTKDGPKKTDPTMKDNLEEAAILSSPPPSPSPLPSDEQQQETEVQQNQDIIFIADDDDNNDNNNIDPQLQSRIDNVLSLLRRYHQSIDQNHVESKGGDADCAHETTVSELEIRRLMIRIYKAQLYRRNGVRFGDSIAIDNDIDRHSRGHRRRGGGSGGGSGGNGGRRSIQSSLVVGDNELIRDMNSIVENNDPSVTTLDVPHGDVRAGHLSRSFLIDRFVHTGLRSNLYLRRLSMTGVSLNNEFLVALGSALSTNFTLQEIILSDNHFLGDGIVNFLRIVGTSNDTCRVIDLRRQRSPVCFARQQNSILEAFENNKSVVEVYFDLEAAGFPKASTTMEVEEKLDKILKRNQKFLRQSMSSETCRYRKGWDAKLLEFFRNEAEMVECMCEEMGSDDPYQFDWDVQHDESDDTIDWEYMYKLSELYDANKARDIIGSQTSETEKGNSPKLTKPILSFHFAQSLQDANLAATLTPDGSFLTEEFISKYLKEDEDLDRLVFDFCGQSYVFKRFSIGDLARPLIISKFVDAILSHPRSSDITGINMANSCIGSDFFVHLADRCLGNSSALPKLNSLNVETNFLGERGVISIARCIASPTTWRYLQNVKLENQKSLLSSRAESALARAVTLNKSIVSVSLRVRNLHEKQVVDQEVGAHIDLLRQARQHHKAEKGIPSPRKRSDIELLFDKVTADDSSVEEVKIVADRQFISLSHEEKMKSACALKNNSHVKSVTLNALGLDDEYALKLADSLQGNSTLQKLHLDNNSFSGSGLISILRALAHHPELKEIQIRHQSKVLASVEEKDIPNLLQANTSLIKVGVDLRNKHTELLLDRKLTNNRYPSRKSVKC